MHIVLETIVIEFFIVGKKTTDNVILECGLTIIVSNILYGEREEGCHDETVNLVFFQLLNFKSLYDIIII